MAAKYRTVGLTSNIDESLFGSDQSNSDSLRGSRKVHTGPLPSSAVVISMHELEKIKNESIIKTENDLVMERARASQLKDERDRKAKERKDRMKQLEALAVQMAKKSDIEVAEMARSEAIRTAAAEKVDANNDVVKLLTSMSCRATAFTIRDEQLEEKKRREEIDTDYDRRMDIIMEIDRIKDIQRREQEEKEKRVKRVEDRKVITQQIEYRHRMKLIGAEAREQENQVMRNTMRKYKDEDEANAVRRQHEIEASRLEVIAANDEAIRRKDDAKQRERREMEDILTYQAMKDAELSKREEEEALLAKAKKERQAKLLAQQERAQNNAGKADEIRARRAAEEKERVQRQRDKDSAVKRKSEMKELLEARARQAASKKDREDREKSVEQEEFNNAVNYMQSMDVREANELRAKHDKSIHHRNQILSQIEEAEKLRASQRSGKFDEGMRTRQEFLAEEAKMKVIRDRMVIDLEDKGVNPRYLSEMRNVDIGKIINR